MQFEKQVITFELEGCEFEFNAPDLDTFEDYQEKVSKKGQKGVAARELCQKCLKDPAKLEDLQSLFEARPAAPLKICDGLIDAAGWSANVTVKKG